MTTYKEYDGCEYFLDALWKAKCDGLSVILPVLETDMSLIRLSGNTKKLSYGSINDSYDKYWVRWVE